MFGIAALLAGCKTEEEVKESAQSFNYVVDHFADVEIMRYQVDNWDSLSLNQKKLVYYLSEAALCGRDIIFDQNCAYNILIKNALEAIVDTYSGDKSTQDWEKFMEYVKRFWFSNGIHHHYSYAKFYPEISKEYFLSLMNGSDKNKIFAGDQLQQKIVMDLIANVIFDTTKVSLKVSQDPNADLVQSSAVNFYRNVTQQEVEEYYEYYRNSLGKAYDPEKPISLGLNSQLVKDLEINKIYERVYCTEGLYAQPLQKVVFWLQKAAEVAENDAQKEHITTLIDYYKTGDLFTWDRYNVQWVEDTQSFVDYVNGFIEVYNDPMGRKATWEAVVDYKDLKNSRRTEIISQNAQWFENNSPIADKFKKENVKGVTAKVITVAHLGGDCFPATPIGINLPNANWIRKEHGSKSVTMENIVYAYAQARMKNGTTDEFYFSEYEISMNEKYGYIADNLLTDMHECLGHGSGQMLPGVSDDLLKNYHSVIEETRADLFSLYFLAGPKLVELELLPEEDAYQAGYYRFIINGLMLQLNRINPGEQITEAHMRNRAIIANWCYENGRADNVIEMVTRDGKTYVKVNDYQKLRELFGKLLAYVQEIKSTGNYKAAADLVEKYGVKVNPTLHQEVLDRFAKLDIAPYGGFVNPKFVVEKDNDGNITDIKLDYSETYVDQMMRYAHEYSTLK